MTVCLDPASLLCHSAAANLFGAQLVFYFLFIFFLRDCKDEYRICWPMFGCLSWIFDSVWSSLAHDLQNRPEIAHKKALCTVLWLLKAVCAVVCSWQTLKSAQANLLNSVNAFADWKAVDVHAWAETHDMVFKCIDVCASLVCTSHHFREPLESSLSSSRSSFYFLNHLSSENQV